VSRAARILRANWTVAFGAVLGALGGGLYAHFIGCRTGTCLLTGDVRTASLFFGITGAIVGLPGPRKAAPKEGDGAASR
jgi:hypothetical protein